MVVYTRDTNVILWFISVSSPKDHSVDVLDIYCCYEVSDKLWFYNINEINS